ncbi:hypothetical protein KC19_4G017700 [Ceratodon purpureus]|uniref:NB-ARC domain-containing protein n=1 Tax=Ceratodon purpureus TaxID=3225 RepID=A0A8T0I5T0_CERPU|nr:hypothetical protein KC19_4G017700 [Ceratodon purpureus]
MGQTQAECSDNVATSSGYRGTKLCDGVYSFYEPEGRPQVEVVFIHSLQLDGDIEKAYWTTWLTRGRPEVNCWPMTWLPRRFPNARILSLSYDASLLRTATTGRMDSYLLGESLVQQMTLDPEVGIGQKDCPVVFVCHGLGGLIAKQIVISGHRGFSKDRKVCNLLSNLKALFFYDTPHGGSILANSARCVPWLPWGPLVEYLEVMNEHVVRSNAEFGSIHRDVFKSAWTFYVVAAMHASSWGIFSAKPVQEASARHDGYRFIGVAANHVDVCKPESETDTGFQFLTSCITEVVESAKKNYHYLVEVPSFSVGIENKLQDVLKRLALHPVVGLVGMGGIGKTTLCKHLYNQMNGAFERCCFLEDVKSQGIDSCQRQLFRDLCGEEWKERESVKYHLNKIEECIITRRVLLVVDDVGIKDNMNKLVVHAFKDGQKGSKVIVTTRRSDTLNEYRESIFDVGLLTEKEASDLFSFYAFHEVHEKERMDLDTHAKAIIKACGGLPLSLEVTGQFLRQYNHFEIGERKHIWKEALDRLQAAKPFEGCDDDEQLWARLQISYDDLADDEKSMFLDFACIFCETCIKTGQLGVRKGWLARIWDSHIGVLNLVNKSLIKWNCETQVYTMHDQLRDMGRAIVRKEVDGKRSRIWKKDDEGEFKTLEGLILCGANEVQFDHLQRQSMESGSTKSFKKLRLLNIIESDSRVGDLYAQYCSKALTWLCLDRTNPTVNSLPQLNRLTGLRVLEISSCDLLQDLPNNIIELSLLMELRISQCTNLKTLPARIGDLKRLQVLDLTLCRSLSDVPESIGELKHLEELNFSGCESLVTLPTSMGGVTSLKTLDCERCTFLREIPESMGDLKNLEELNFSGCLSLVTLPTSMGGVTSLKTLDCERCTFLREIPESMGDLKNLEELNFRWCKSLVRLPTSMGGVTSLKTLYCKGCTSLKEIPEWMGDFKNLEVLNFSGCESLLRLRTSMGGVTSLKTLIFGGCTSLKEIPESMGDLKNLEVLNFSGCESLLRLRTSMGGVTSLKTLIFGGCTSLKEIPESMGDLKNLEVLNFSGCESLLRLLTSMGGVTSLKTLIFGVCTSLKEIPESMGDLKNLEKLDFWRCESLVTLPTSMGRLTSLKTLNCERCTSLREIPESMGDLKNLVELNISGCESLLRLPTSMGGVTSLKTLNCEDCSSLSDIPQCMGDLKNLEELNFSGCLSLVTLPTSMGGLTSLKTLIFGGCTSLKEIPESMGDLKNLEELAFWGCESLVTLPTSMGGLTSLKTLNCEGCTSLREIPESMGDLKNLEELNFRWCKSLVRLPTSMGGVTSLKSLIFGGCTSLKEIPQCMGDLKNLEELNFWGCESLVTLPTSMGGLTSLKTLNCGHCTSLREIPESMGDLKNLEELNFRWCKSLVRLPTSMGGVTSLKSLIFGGCTSLKEIPESMGDLKNLEELAFWGCESLVTLPTSMGRLTSLKTLNCEGCSSLSEVPESMGDLKNL